MVVPSVLFPINAVVEVVTIVPVAVVPVLAVVIALVELVAGGAVVVSLVISPSNAVVVAICTIPDLATHVSSRHSQTPLHQAAPLPWGQPRQPVVE